MQFSKNSFFADAYVILAFTCQISAGCSGLSYAMIFSLTSSLIYMDVKMFALQKKFSFV